MGQIAELMLKAKKYKACDMAMKQMMDITDIKRKSEDFANAREMRNIIDQVIMCQNVRCMGENNKQIELTDVNTYMENMLDINPGMKSRIQFKLDFADYTKDELRDITFAFLSKKQYDIDEDAMEKLLDIAEYYRQSPDFANARTVRNILDQVIMNQNLRTEDDEQPDNVIILSYVDDYISDEGIDLSSGHSKMNKIGF